MIITRQEVKKIYLSLISSFALVIMGLLPAPAQNIEPSCQYHINLEYELHMPLYFWPASTSPKGIVVTIHGLTMHGKSFDKLGKTLAKEGFHVYSTDMRGYGRLTKDYAHEFCSTKDCKQEINYDKTLSDITSLVDRLHSEFPGIPLYIIGESLGADIAIRLANNRPEMISGLILSAPALKTNNFLDSPHIIKFLSIGVLNIYQPLDLMPFVQKYASCDPQVIKELVEDPLLKRRMSTYELYLSHRTINDTINFVPNIAMPVLVMQSKDDHCVRPNAAKTLMKHLKCEHKEIKWFDNRGHILIETAHMKRDTVQTMLTWLNEHVTCTQAQLPLDSKNVIVSDPVALEENEDRN